MTTVHSKFISWIPRCIGMHDSPATHCIPQLALDQELVPALHTNTCLAVLEWDVEGIDRTSTPEHDLERAMLTLMSRPPSLMTTTHAASKLR